MVDPSRHVQMYASTEATGATGLRPESQYTTEQSDNEQAGLSDNDDNNSVRTVIVRSKRNRSGELLIFFCLQEIDSAGHPVFAGMNGVKSNSPAYDRSYADTLRANSLQRRIASGIYANSGYQVRAEVAYRKVKWPFPFLYFYRRTPMANCQASVLNPLSLRTKFRRP